MSSTNKTSKLGLSQYIATDKPTYLQDYNTDMRNIDDYVGQVTRTATVIIGLEDSGYTVNQVDVLIPSGTADCSTYISQAITKLSSAGGEIKLLDGVYNCNSSTIGGYGKDITLIGSGQTTISNLTITNIDNKNIIVNNLTLSSTLIYLGGSAVAQFSNVVFTSNSAINAASLNGYLYTTNCIGIVVNGKTVNNWRNIYVDGVAEYAAVNTSILLDTNAAVTIPLLDYKLGDEMDCLFTVTDSGLQAGVIPEIKDINGTYRIPALFFNNNLGNIAITQTSLQKYGLQSINIYVLKITLRRHS